MNNYQPYTYLIRFKPTGQIYYGSSYANKSKIANPSQLWTSYFTSSKIIKQLITEYGTDSFEVEVRQIFESPEQAINWEHKVLSKFDAKNNPVWINENNGDKKFKNDGHSEETRQKISLSNKGQISNRKGKPLSEEHKKKIAESNKGKPKSLEHKEKIRENSIGKSHSEETKKLMREKRKGKTMSEETKRKISLANAGRTLPNRSMETRKKLSEAATGRVQTAETKQKISNRKKLLFAQKQGKIYE
jgi:hypothetical protein